MPYVYLSMPNLLVTLHGSRNGPSDEEPIHVLSIGCFSWDRPPCYPGCWTCLLSSGVRTKGLRISVDRPASAG